MQMKFHLRNENRIFNYTQIPDPGSMREAIAGEDQAEE